MKVICPKCKAVYSIGGLKISFNNRKTAKCIKCESRFYIERQEKKQRGDNKVSRITFLLSYFEKRKYIERRKGIDRRKKIEKNDLLFMTPPKDFIPILNSKNHLMGYTIPGRRGGEDRRTGIERRKPLHLS